MPDSGWCRSDDSSSDRAGFIDRAGITDRMWVADHARVVGQRVVTGTQPVNVVRPVITVATSPGSAGAGPAVGVGVAAALVVADDRVLDAVAGNWAGVPDEDVPVAPPTWRTVDRGEAAVERGVELAVAGAGGVAVTTVSRWIRPFASGTSATTAPFTVLTGAVTVVIAVLPSAPMDCTVTTLAGFGVASAAGFDPLRLPMETMATTATTAAAIPPATTTGRR